MGWFVYLGKYRWQTTSEHVEMEPGWAVKGVVFTVLFGQMPKEGNIALVMSKSALSIKL